MELVWVVRGLCNVKAYVVNACGSRTPLLVFQLEKRSPFFSQNYSFDFDLTFDPLLKALVQKRGEVCCSLK